MGLGPPSGLCHSGCFLVVTRSCPGAHVPLADPGCLSRGQLLLLLLLLLAALGGCSAHTSQCGRCSLVSVTLPAPARRAAGMPSQPRPRLVALGKLVGVAAHAPRHGKRRCIQVAQLLVCHSNRDKRFGLPSPVAGPLVQAECHPAAV